jgi:hypothetical protein
LENWVAYVRESWFDGEKFMVRAPRTWNALDGAPRYYCDHPADASAVAAADAAWAEQGRGPQARRSHVE